MKNKRIMALALVSTLTVSALIPSALAATSQDSGEETTVQETARGGRYGKHGEKSSVAEPENAIGKDAAKEKALTDAGVTAEQAGKVKARVSQTDDGTVIYKVRFNYDGQRYSYQIDAITGAILDKSSEAATESTGRQGSKHGEKSSVAEPENAIGKDAAKEKTLVDAGVTAEQAGKVKARVSQTDDGTVIYKVRFTYDGQRYSYQINAITGEILDKSSEAAMERADRQDSRGRHGNRPEAGDEAASTAV